MKNRLSAVLAVTALVLLFLLLRENEARVAAESKLSTLQFKSTSAIAEKGDAIADLSTQLGELEAHLQRTSDEAGLAVQDREAQIVKLNEESQIREAEHAAALEEKARLLAELEARMKEASERSDKGMKRKNAEMSEMGEQLRQSTERLAAVLREKEEIESRNYDLESSIADARRSLDRLSEDNRRLEALAKVCIGTQPIE